MRARIGLNFFSGRKTVPQAHTADLQRKRGARRAHARVCRTHDRLGTCPHPAARVTDPRIT
eukprot:6321337-Prymnesium_polylepis.1